jgi:hypothetical protein
MYGIDFHQDDQPFNASGSYSTHLFVQRAEQIIKDHVTTNASKSKVLVICIRVSLNIKKPFKSW